MELMFGIGALWGQRTDVNGLPIGIGPHQFAILQDTAIDFDFETKDLYSQLGFPLDSARGKGKVTGKSKMARVYAALYADLFFGETFSAGEFNVAQNEAVTLSGTGYTAANAAAFVANLGVVVLAGGQQILKLVTGSPGPTEYTVSTAGVYGFNATLTGTQVAVSYVFTDSAGFKFTINNNLMGFTPTFQATFYHNNPTLRSTGQMTLTLNTCISSRLTFPTRVGEYTLPDFDFMAIGDGANRVGVMSLSE